MGLNEKIIEWMANGKTGISSKSMALCAAGFENTSTFGDCPPSDPSDFNRCLLLLDFIPEIRLHFHDISNLNDGWNKIIRNFDKIEKCFLEEVGLDWCKGHSAPRTYELMKKIQGR